MHCVIEMLTGSYRYGFVVLSVLLGMVAAYAALDFTGRISAARRRTRIFWLGGGSVSMGLGIWAMHYIGMLAFTLPIPVLYHYPTVIVSLLAGIAASAVALFTVSRESMSRASCFWGSLAMGSGIAGMHYIGMAAMRMPAMMQYRWSLVALSVMLAISGSFLALTLSFRVRQEHAWPGKQLSAVIMGLAIALMHYTGMWAVRFYHCDDRFSLHSTVRVSLLGAVVITVTILSVMLLTIVIAFVDRWMAMQSAIAEAARDNEARFRTLAEAIPQIVWTAGPDGMTTYINQHWYEMTGMPRGDGLGSAWMSVVHPDDRDPCEKKWRQAMQTGETFEIEYRLSDALQGYRWYLDRAVPLRDSDGAIQQWFGTCTDIHDRMQNQRVLEEQVKRHTTALMEANLRLESEMRERALAQQELNDQNARMLRELTRRSNRATTIVKTAELLQSCADIQDILSVIAGMAPKVFPELRGAVLLLNPSRDALERVSSWTDCRVSEAMFTPEDCWALRTGHMHFVRAGDVTAQCRHAPPGAHSYFCVPLLSPGGAIGVLHFQQIEESEIPESIVLMAPMFAEQISLSVANLRLREALRNQSIRDPLTGLFNRRYLEEMLAREVRRAVRAEQSLGILMLDLDHFKKFNDTYGHDAGDTVLRETANLLSASVRAEDTVCRFGGEEFVILLPMADLKATHARAERIRSKLRELAVLHQGRSVGMVTVSAGVAELPQHGMTPQVLLEAADRALYQAKKQGRDCVSIAGSQPLE